MSAAEPTQGSAAECLPSGRSLTALRRAARGCRGCPLWKDATQTVFGEGRSRAELTLVGQQPGDREDRRGSPFVGPAGGLLDKVLVEAGIDRDAVYLTNAVKHFKWQPRGKRRLHQTPRAGEVEACKPWLEAELEAVRPSAVVALGAVTVHPSAILRVRDRDERDDAFAGLVEDLRAVCAAIHDGVGDRA